MGLLQSLLLRYVDLLSKEHSTREAAVKNTARPYHKDGLFIFFFHLCENAIVELSVLDVEKFVLINKLKLVTDPIFFEAGGAPTANGLFSFELFGRQGSVERQRQWAYIDLKQVFLHPLIYKTCLQLDRKFSQIISGERYVKLSQYGYIEEADEQTGWTGMDALFKNWEMIRWEKKGDVGQRFERIETIRSTPKHRCFITKWHVMPALFRDTDTSLDGAIREIQPVNYSYSRLITTAPPVASGLNFADGAKRLRAQDILLDIHTFSLSLISGKRGLIQDVLLGKNADWGVRGVISGPIISTANTPDEQEVPFNHIGIPLYLLVNMYQPFVINKLNELTKSVFSEQRVIFSNKEGNIEIPPEVKEILGPELFKKWISRYMRSQENRLDKVSVELPNGKNYVLPLFMPNGENYTLTDLFFVVVSDIIKDKYAMYTRYPVEDFRACHFAKPVILTTQKTIPEVIIQGNTFKRYPNLVKPRWIDSIRINNANTNAMGADYDGDTIRVFGLFTKEANAEAEKLMYQNTNYCDGQGMSSRNLGNEAILTLYALTK